MGTTAKNSLSIHPNQIIILTAKHTGNLLRCPLSCPAFSRTRLISFYFSWLQYREQAKEGKENELSALLKRFMISHTHSQAMSLTDTTPLISRHENWHASWSWATAPSLVGLRGPNMPWVLPHPVMSKASWGRSKWNWIPRCQINLFYALFCLKYNDSEAQLVWNLGKYFSCYTETVTWLGHHYLPRLPLEDPRAEHVCGLAALILLCSAIAWGLLFLELEMFLSLSEKYQQL